MLASLEAGQGLVSGLVDDSVSHRAMPAQNAGWSWKLNVPPVAVCGGNPRPQTCRCSSSRTAAAAAHQTVRLLDGEAETVLRRAGSPDNSSRLRVDLELVG